MKIASLVACLMVGVLAWQCYADEPTLAPIADLEHHPARGAIRHLDDSARPTTPVVDEQSSLAPNDSDSPNDASRDPNQPLNLAPIVGVDEWKQAPAAGGCSNCDRHARAGHPQELSLLARLTYGFNYRGYKVGGGQTPRKRAHGRPLHRGEGTFGVDYNPWYSRVALLQSGGRLYQGGTGQYEQDRRNHPFHQTVR